MSVLLLVWSVRATALPGEERLQSTRVSTTRPGQEQDRAKERRIRARRLYLMQLFHPSTFQGITASRAAKPRAVTMACWPVGLGKVPGQMPESWKKRRLS